MIDKNIEKYDHSQFYDVINVRYLTNHWFDDFIVFDQIVRNWEWDRYKMTKSTDLFAKLKLIKTC